MKLKPMTSIVENEPLPVRHIKPPKTKEPAELCTIATVLLRKNRAMFEDRETKDALLCLSYLSRSMERQLTEKEAKRAIALIAVLREKA